VAIINVIISNAAGCQTIGCYPYREAEFKKSRAVEGLTDPSARVYVRKQRNDPHLMTFAALRTSVISGKVFILVIRI
jgi:hypothetical protein